MKVNDLNKLKTRVGILLVEKGFFDVIERKDVYEVTSLIHTEISEYTQLYKRHGLDEEHKAERVEEIADMVIRIMSLLLIEGASGDDLWEAIHRKMDVNFTRPFKFNTYEQKGE